MEQLVSVVLKNRHLWLTMIACYIEISRVEGMRVPSVLYHQKGKRRTRL